MIIRLSEPGRLAALVTPSHPAKQVRRGSPNQGAQPTRGGSPLDIGGKADNQSCFIYCKGNKKNGKMSSMKHKMFAHIGLFP